MFPRRDLIRSRTFGEVERFADSTGCLQLSRRHRPQMIQAGAFDEFLPKRALHVGGHRLERLLTDFREMAAFIDHAAKLSAHADRAGLAGVLGTHGFPHVPPANSLCELKTVSNGFPATTAARSLHRLTVDENNSEYSPSGSSR